MSRQDARDLCASITVATAPEAERRSARDKCEIRSTCETRLGGDTSSAVDPMPSTPLFLAHGMPSRPRSGALGVLESKRRQARRMVAVASWYES
jgi:hypothetical protein